MASRAVTSDREDLSHTLFRVTMFLQKFYFYHSPIEVKLGFIAKPNVKYEYTLNG